MNGFVPPVCNSCERLNHRRNTLCTIWFLHDSLVLDIFAGRHAWLLEGSALFFRILPYWQTIFSFHYCLSLILFIYSSFITSVYFIVPSCDSHSRNINASYPILSCHSCSNKAQEAFQFYNKKLRKRLPFNASVHKTLRVTLNDEEKALLCDRSVLKKVKP